MDCEDAPSGQSGEKEKRKIEREQEREGEPRGSRDIFENSNRLLETTGCATTRTRVDTGGGSGGKRGPDNEDAREVDTEKR